MIKYKHLISEIFMLKSYIFILLLLNCTDISSTATNNTECSNDPDRNIKIFADENASYIIADGQLYFTGEKILLASQKRKTPNVGKAHILATRAEINLIGTNFLSLRLIYTLTIKKVNFLAQDQAEAI